MWLISGVTNFINYTIIVTFCIGYKRLVRDDCYQYLVTFFYLQFYLLSRTYVKTMSIKERYFNYNNKLILVDTSIIYYIDFIDLEPLRTN